MVLPQKAIPQNGPVSRVHACFEWNPHMWQRHFCDSLQTDEIGSPTLGHPAKPRRAARELNISRAHEADGCRTAGDPDLQSGKVASLQGTSMFVFCCLCGHHNCHLPLAKLFHWVLEGLPPRHRVRILTHSKTLFVGNLGPTESRCCLKSCTYCRSFAKHRSRISFVSSVPNASRWNECHSGPPRYGL